MSDNGALFAAWVGVAHTLNGHNHRDTLEASGKPDASRSDYEIVICDGWHRWVVGIGLGALVSLRAWGGAETGLASANHEGAAPAQQRLGEPVRASGYRPPAAGSSRAAAALSAKQTVRYDHGDPTPQEQLMLELVNRSRSDPAAEAGGLGIDLNQGLPHGTISPNPKPPLTLHPFLIDAARVHSDWMIQTDIFSHTGAQGSSPGDRMTAAGYPFSGSWTWGENIAWVGTTGQPDLTDFTVQSHEGLFKSPGHRENLMNAEFQEIGIGVREGEYTEDGTDFNSVMTTQNFARSGGTPGPFVLGVVFEDTNANGAYDVGEGLAGVEVRPDRGDYHAITSASGGYALPAPATSGASTVTFSGAGLPVAIAKQIGLSAQNVKLDLETLGEQPLVFLAGTARLDPDGAFRCEISGPAGASLLIQTSSDGVSWVDVGGARLTAASWPFVDIEAGQQAHRLYRAVLQD